VIDVDLSSAAASLLEGVPQLVWAADAYGSVTYVNNRWTEYTGMPFTALLGPGWTTAIEPGQRESVVAGWMSDVEARVAVSERRLQYRRFDGGYAWFLWRAVPVFDRAREVTRWIGTLTDIDHQVRLENVLSASEQRYRSIIETTQEGVWIIDAEARTQYVNRRFAEMLGYDPDELFGVSAFDLFRASDHVMVAEQVARRRGGEASQESAEFHQHLA